MNLYLLIIFLILSFSLWVSFYLFSVRRFEHLNECMRAIADREQFIQIPYLRARGLHGKLARGLQALKEAVTAADALAAEQKAAQDQYRSSSFAQKWFIDTFNKSERGLNAAITEIDEAAHSLRITAGTMLD